MRHLALTAVVFAALAAPAAAQPEDFPVPPATYPTLPATAASAEAFTPRGWKLESRAVGDLNGDGRPDMAFVIHGLDPALVVKNEGLGEDQLDTNPRILVIAFAQASGGYRRVLENHSFIVRRYMATMSDHFDGETALRIERGAVKIRLEMWMSAGGWGMFGADYTFRWQHDRLELIGYDRTDTQRNTGETRSVSINYSTGKVKIATGNIESDDDKVEWKTLPDRRLRSIEELGDGLEFDAGFSE